MCRRPRAGLGLPPPAPLLAESASGGPAPLLWPPPADPRRFPPLLADLLHPVLLPRRSTPWGMVSPPGIFRPRCSALTPLPWRDPPLAGWLRRFRLPQRIRAEVHHRRTGSAPLVSTPDKAHSLSRPPHLCLPPSFSCHGYRGGSRRKEIEGEGIRYAHTEVLHKKLLLVRFD